MSKKGIWWDDDVDKVWFVVSLKSSSRSSKRVGGDSKKLENGWGKSRWKRDKINRISAVVERVKKNKTHNLLNLKWEEEIGNSKESKKWLIDWFDFENELIGVMREGIDKGEVVEEEEEVEEEEDDDDELKLWHGVVEVEIESNGDWSSFSLVGIGV